MTTNRNNENSWKDRSLLFVDGQPEDGRLMTAGEVARLAEISVRTLQHYDDIGLLCPRRSGEGVANNRKLYDEDDIDRLGRIVALKGYGLTLSEVKEVIDDEGERVIALLDAKLRELRRQEVELRNLVLFARFLSVTEVDLIDGFMAGSTIVNDLADAARELPPYEHGRCWADELETPEERAVAFLALDKIIEEFDAAGTAAGFSTFERLVALLSSWWDLYVHPYDDLGLLGWWALFEDERALAAEVERVGGAAMCANVEMAFFLVFLRRFMAEAAPLARDIAAGDPDADDAAGQLGPGARQAAERLAWLIGRMTGGFYRTRSLVADVPGRQRFSRLCEAVLAWTANGLADAELMAFIDPAGAVDFDRKWLPAAAVAVARVVEEGAGGRPPEYWGRLRAAGE